MKQVFVDRGLGREVEGREALQQHTLLTGLRAVVLTEGAAMVWNKPIFFHSFFLFFYGRSSEGQPPTAAIRSLVGPPEVPPSPGLRPV